jgi:TolA-binding protein
VLRDADEAGIDVVLARRPVADLAALADAARYGHRNDLARRTLQTERSRFPRASESRSAAFLLGRMAEESGDTREALSEYDTCLRESPDGALAQEALGRKLGVLRQNKSDGAEARSAASEYLRRFPTGPYAHIAEEMTRGP